MLAVRYALFLLLFAVCCMRLIGLFVVGCCIVVVVCCSWYAVCCLLSFSVSCMSLVFVCLLFVVWIRCLLFVGVCSSWFVVCCY